MSDFANLPLGLLGENLHRISENEFIDLIYDLEQRRRNPAKKEQIDEILNRLRPRSSLVRPPRLMTAMRVLCIPFEELLSTYRGENATGARIGRSLIPSLWKVVEQNANAAIIDNVDDAVTEPATLEPEVLLDIAEPLWQHAALVFKDVLSRPRRTAAEKAAFEELFGGSNQARAVELVRDSLEAGRILVEFRYALSRKPIKTVRNDDLDALINALKAALPLGAAPLRPILLTLIGRLEDPSLLITFFARMTDLGHGSLVTASGGEAGEAMVGRAEDSVSDIDALAASSTSETGEDGVEKPKPVPREAVSRGIETAIRDLEGASTTVNAFGDRSQEKRLQTIRADVTHRVEREILAPTRDEGPEILATALSRSADDGSLRTEGTAAAASRDAGDALQDMEDRVISLRVAERYAPAVGLAQAVDTCLTTIRDSLDKTTGDIMSDISQGDLGFKERGRIEESVFHAVRLLELASGSDSADKFRKSAISQLYADD